MASRIRFIACALVATAVSPVFWQVARGGGGLEASQPGGVGPQDHWAWIRPVSPEPPRVNRAGWARNPIDLFVLAALEKAGLGPSPEADRYTLIRRVSLDLIGLPPTPDEVAQFASDPLPDAYERLVDRRLSDPAFGERWARMWLDLARYADSKGYGSDPLRANIWRYRDWVIDSFNRNVPYDQFTVEQLAGDLLPNATPRQILATAFHRNTMSNDEGGTDDEQFRVEAIKDRIDSTMQIWMGITMGCAKCHSHKYDPITHREYYQFFAYFNQTEDADRNDEEPRFKSPTAAQLADRQRWTDDLARLKQRYDTPDPALVEKLATGQAKWEETVVAQRSHWVVLEPREFSVAGGARLEKLPDHSLLASGPSTDTETYTITSDTRLAGVTAIRLELLPHESLPASGPGRAGGNLVLNELRVAVQDLQARPPAGRYLRVEIPGTQRILSLAEVEVFRHVTGSATSPNSVPADVRSASDNVARTGRASQSSTDYDGPAHLAIDGNSNGHYFDAKSTTHTKTEDNPWWEVDLGAVTELDRVVIWNRTDGSVGTRLSNFRVALLGEDRKPVWETKVAESPQPRVELALGGPSNATLRNPTADFAQEEFPVAKAIDGDAGAKSGWGIGPQVGKAHEAVFEFAKPVGSESGTQLTVTLAQTYGSSHTLGRFRLSMTSASPPPAALPGRITELVATPKSQRTAEQAAELAAYYRSIAPELVELRNAVAGLERRIKELDEAVPAVPIMRELPPDKRRATHVLLKSNFLLPGDQVEAAVPAALHTMPAGAPADRLGLAQWLTSPENPLTARVAVNRFWSQLFGRGLVETEEDFGTQGTPPTHPELLDWLAAEFMHPSAAPGSGAAWDMKTLLRLIVTSATYRQSSTASLELMQRDAGNRLLAHGPRHRLEAEMVRDQALALAGLLSRKVGGPSVYPPQPAGLWRAAFNGQRTWATSTGEDRYRRGLYTFWRRTVPYPSMSTFDAPSREICTIRRTPTNTPLQAFVTLNDPVFVEAAQALARRMVREGGNSPDTRVAFGLELCLARPPHPEQIRELVALYNTELNHYRQDQAAAVQMASEPLGPLPDGSDAGELAACTVVCNVLLNLDGVLSKR